MLGAIKELGSYALQSGTSFVDSLVQEIEGEDKFVGFLDFYPEKEYWAIEVKDKAENDEAKYLFWGNIKGAGLQFYPTTSTLRYLLGQSVGAIAERLMAGELKDQFNLLLDKFYIDAGDNYGRDRRILNVFESSLQIKEGGITRLAKLPDLFTGKQKMPITFQEFLFAAGKDLSKTLEKYFQQYVKQQGYNPRDIVMWVLKLNGVPVSEQQDYRNMVLKFKLDDLFVGTPSGSCSLCAAEKPVISDEIRFNCKYFITDKMGFSSANKGNFSASMALCSKCYQEVLAGEALIRNHLNVRIGPNTAYLIPMVFYEPEENFKEWISQELLLNFELINDAENIYKREKEVNRRAKKDNNYLINILIYKASKAEFKVIRLIKDIPPSRVKRILEESWESHRLAQELLGRNWNFDLTLLYWLVPIKDSKDKPAYNLLLQLIENIFYGRLINKSLLLQLFLELFEAIYYDRLDSYLYLKRNKTADKDWLLREKVLQSSLLVRMLESLNTLKRKEGIVMASWLKNQNIKEYIEKLSLGEPETAMFLLGVLLAQVGIAQYNKGLKSKPILKKVKFQGMDLKQSLNLAIAIFEKLNEYKKSDNNLLDNNTAFIEQFERLIAPYKDKWPLTGKENVFYLMCGYAYVTDYVIRKGEAKR